MKFEWKPIETAPRDGQQIVLRFFCPFGFYEILEGHFLHDDNEFYRVDPPTKIKAKPTHWDYLNQESYIEEAVDKVLCQ